LYVELNREHFQVVVLILRSEFKQRFRDAVNDHIGLEPDTPS